MPNAAMRTVELFCGTKSFSKVAAKWGYETWTTDINPRFKPTIVKDLMRFFSVEVPDCSILWASPPCQSFSVASIGTHWTGGKRAYIPKTERAVVGLALLERTVMLIAERRPRFWFIENPRGVMRKVIEPLFKKYGISDWRRVTVMYCQYGDSRMKPTDIWTNLRGWEGKRCHNGAADYERAPRGAKTGTQGLKGATERGVIPPALFEEIFEEISEAKK